ncbi:hypothetical protein P7C70_g1478, partial [Phenoliferia sp. Uapishka_3]
MSTFVILARTALYSALVLFSLLAFILAAALTAKTESPSDSGYSDYWSGYEYTIKYYFPAAAEVLSAGLLAVLVIPPLHFFFHRREANSIVSALWVEFVIAGVFFLLFLGGAASMANLLNNGFGVDGGDYTFSSCHSSMCDLFSATMAFAWLAWITTFALLILLLFVVISESGKGRTGVLTERFAVSQAAAPGEKAVGVVPAVPIEPSPIPMSENRAEFLIDALGGESECKRLVGGVKWWQLRSEGVGGEWLCAKHDLDCEDAAKADHLGTILYVTGGGESTIPEQTLKELTLIFPGFYFGSLETHRFMIWKHARNSGMRAFGKLGRLGASSFVRFDTSKHSQTDRPLMLEGVNYRKAPQFPFPCGLQDCIASYLYLIRPPPEASHKPVDPRSIVLSGDSAGAGMVLSMLQVIRHAGLPMPAGTGLVSPWVDLSHSFPSVDKNTPTDIIPPYSFIHRPSLAWPPPDEPPLPPIPPKSPSAPEDHTSAVCDPLEASDTKAITLEMKSSHLDIPTQMQIYAGIFVAHKCSGHIKDSPEESRAEKAYPALFRGKDSWEPADVHLQVYDAASHILPIFSYTEIARPTYASLATFFKFCTTRKDVKRAGSTSAPKRRVCDEPNGYAKEPFVDRMIRERVSVHGRIRPMEDLSDLSCSQTPKDTIGMVKAPMVRRFLEGRHLWDKKFPHDIYRVAEERKRYEDQWRAEGHKGDADFLEGEKPPASALAGRRDSPAAHELAQKTQISEAVKSKTER